MVNKKAVPLLILCFAVLLSGCKKKEENKVITRVDTDNATTLNADKTEIFVPSNGQSYAHHPHITIFKGKLYAVFSCGKKNEDDLGQKVMLCTSEDGINWSEPRVLVSPSDVGSETGVLTAGGFYSTETRLVVYFGYYKYSDASCENGMRPQTDASHEDTMCYAVTTENGDDFSAPLSLNIPVVPNFGPFITSTGRLILCGNISFPYSDDPSGTGSFTMTGIYGNAFENGEIVDDSASIGSVTKKNGWDASLICESSILELSRKHLRAFFRSNSGFLWASESYDGGKTWGEPYKTEFVSDSSKFFMGKLKNEYFYIGNPLNNNYRLPLCLYLSKDGCDFDKAFIIADDIYYQKYDGLYKGGIYGYPHAVYDDTYMYVIYSKHKETVEVSRFLLSELEVVGGDGSR